MEWVKLGVSCSICELNGDPYRAAVCRTFVSSGLAITDPGDVTTGVLALECR